MMEENEPIPKEVLDKAIVKMNDFDEARIKKFIQSFHNRGPEQTVE